MAINAEVSSIQIQPKSLYSTTISKNSKASPQFMKLAKEWEINDGIKINKTKISTSPYFTNDKIQLISSVTEKKMTRKKNETSSFPLTAKIYRANSDELTLPKRINKKVKKSVLTLPNEPLLKPEACTVSDMNDSEYFKRDDEDRKYKNRHRLPKQYKRQPRVRNNNFEYYDRDARYCSQLNIDLDSSSNDIIDDYNRDHKPTFKKSLTASIPPGNGEYNAHDVWAALRNINRLQFRRSPPISEDSIPTRKKQPLNKKRKGRNATRLIETCTEEFALISSYGVESKSNFSISSSFDRITVINKHDEFDKIYKEFENNISGKRNLKKGTANMKGYTQIKTKVKKIKAVSKQNKKENQLETSNENIEDISSIYDRIHSNINENTESHIIDTMPLNCLNSYDYNDATLLMKNNKNDEISLNNKFKEENEDVKSDHSKVVQSGDCHNTVFSGHSGSSKAALHQVVHNRQVKANTHKVSSTQSGQQMNGITKVVVSKASDISPPKRNYALYKKPRLVATIPNTIPPKLTQTEIRRRLANMKFPIVILGKDQLGSSSFEVKPFEAYQFNGLDGQIWPFMVEWYEKIISTEGQNKSIPDIDTKENNKDRSMRTTNNITIKTYTPSTKYPIINFNKMHNINISTNKMNLNPKRKSAGQKINPINLTQEKKEKPTRQFKDKLLLLYKNSSIGNVAQVKQIGVQGGIKNQICNNVQQRKHLKKMGQMEAGTQTFNKINQNGDFSKTTPLKIIKTNLPWARAKWANDFIDNVMKNIKNGVYYSQENKVKMHSTDSKEASIQTTLCIKLSSIDDTKDQSINNITPEIVTQNRNDFLDKIPGFDDALPAVEIKTFTLREISVQHRLTNVTVQFDITRSTEPDYIALSTQKSSSLVPITNTENELKIFKCKTTIVNAVLPAELCRILPKMIKLIKHNSSNKSGFPLVFSEKKQNCILSPISESVHNESVYVFKKYVMPFTVISTTRPIIKGTFSNTLIENQSVIKKKKFKKLYSLPSIRDLFEKLEIRSMFYLGGTVNYTSFSKQGYNTSYESNVPLEVKSSVCTSLEAYSVTKRSLISTRFSYNFLNMLKKLWGNNIVINLNMTALPPLLPERVNNIEITVYNIPFNPYVLPDNSNTIFNGFWKENDLESKNVNMYDTNILTNKYIEYVKQPSKSQKKCIQDSASSNARIRKKCFCRLYKKCKSTSNISTERSSTSLSKITNLEDFCLALGSGKLITSMFDEYAEKRIMSCITEMKNWISEISQTQAMLILLLTNKKDTANLVRYRPVLLQGIAVNRITRVSDLDMEIEVIETENLNKLSQYEGIMSYIKRSEQNNDNLLEEMFWIAKTTASDYQKPFDESSERLLKSLLEKRKKLNPSYLRVMARYVGLGLLKPLKNT